MRKLKLIYVPEPTLEFRFGQKTDYARDGLFLFGPVDATDLRRQIRYGVIGTPDSIRRFGEWADQVSGYIEVPAPGKLSKEISPHHVPFPGFSEAFNAVWSKKPAHIIDDISEESLKNLMNIANRHEAIKTVVDEFVDRLIAHQTKSEDPPSFWYVVIPDFIFDLGRPNSTVPLSERIKGKVNITEKAIAQLAIQPTLFGLDEEQAVYFKYAKNFRRQLKARLLKNQIVTQIVRESTLTPYEFTMTNGEPKRRLEDPATVAWKLCTGSYYKSGGRPWQLGDIRPGVCYVGLVYKKQPEDKDIRWSCCAAQMFLSSGEGIVFRGALGPWFNPDNKQFHLDRSSAHRLIATVIHEYHKIHGEHPRELFIHAKSAFNEDEWNGFKDGADLNTNVVGIQISDAWDQLKLFRTGEYPVLRGTALLNGDNSAFLWTTGYVTRLATYMGPETPNPLRVTIRRGKADIVTVLTDVLSLSKINFNTCLFNDRSPVTIKFADAIGDILVSAPVEAEPMLPFKFYI